MQVPKKIGDKSKSEQGNKTNLIVFQYASFNDFSQKYINKNFYEDQIDLLNYNNHFCLITNLHNVCKRNKNLQNYAECV